MTTIQSQSDEQTPVHWKETFHLQGNPYLLKPRVEMLHPGGTKIFKKFVPPGRGGVATKKVTYTYVTYDRSYVAHYIYETVIKLFPRIPYNELQKLISEAIQIKKEKDKEWNEKNR
ncbi:MAG: hypothetical protein KME45_23210 [Stenomitos rutilans HA7619-LM2]|jgi:hypothetical protein|nr:hypothetical protein [Stenomitos rutilans HA7619-LM2]